MSFQLFSHNGIIKSSTEATISLFNIEYAYGFGVYENLRVSHRVVYFVDDHIDRLFFSASAIGLIHSLHKKQIKQWIQELISSITEPTFNLKILLIGAANPAAVQCMILPLSPLFPNRQLYTKGAKVKTVQYERFLPNAKTLNMLPSYLYYSNAKAKSCYDVIFCDRKNNILEGSRTNFFVIKNKIIHTAPAEKVLQGVTKKMAMKVASRAGFKIVETNIPLHKITKYDGAFLTSTSSKIIPIAQIDSTVLSAIPGNLRELMRGFDQFLDEYRTAHEYS